MPVTLLPIWVFLGTLIVAPQLWWGPMLNWRIDYFVFPLWIAVVAVSGRIPILLKLTLADGFFLLMFLWILLSILTNGYSDTGAERIFWYARSYLIFRLTVTSIQNLRELRHAIGAILVLSTLIAVEGIQHANSTDGLGWAGQSFSWVNEAAKEIGLESRIRWVGIFDGPGVLCSLFTAALPFAFTYLLHPTPIPKRILLGVTTSVLLLLAIYYTGSRGGILATAATVGLFFLARNQFKPKTIILAALVGLAAIALAPAYLTDSKDSSHSAQGRVDMWAFGLEMVEGNPVFGIGKGNYADYTGRLVAHNSALEVVGETGLPGQFFWISLIYLAVRSLLAAGKLENEAGNRHIYTSIAICIGGYLVSSLFVSLETVLFYFILGLAAAVPAWAKGEGGWSRRDTVIILTIMAGFYVAMKLFVMQYY